MILFYSIQLIPNYQTDMGHFT